MFQDETLFLLLYDENLNFDVNSFILPSGTNVAIPHLSRETLS